MLAFASPQDQSRAIQAQQQREAEQRGEQQRRELIRQERQREAQAREEQELAARRRAEAQAEGQRQRQQAETDSPQPEHQSDLTPVRVSETTAKSNVAEPVNSAVLGLRVIGIALMAVCAVSLLGILIRYRVKRPTDPHFL
jgi:cobalamin biosynthesis Mg chelatase CobN